MQMNWRPIQCQNKHEYHTARDTVLLHSHFLAISFFRGLKQLSRVSGNISKSSLQKALIIWARLHLLVSFSGDPISLMIYSTFLFEIAREFANYMRREKSDKNDSQIEDIYMQIRAQKVEILPKRCIDFLTQKYGRIWLNSNRKIVCYLQLYRWC